MLKTRASFDSLHVDTLSGKAKFSIPTLRRYSSTNNLQHEHINTPQIIHRSLSSIFKKIPKTLDEKNENDYSLDDDNASIISSNSSQVSFDDTEYTKSKKFISIFNNAFNNKNNSNHHHIHKRKKYNFNEIIVSNEIIITHTDSKDIMDEIDASGPFPTYETHLQTPTQNYSYYYPHKNTVTNSTVHGKELLTIPDEYHEKDFRNFRETLISLPESTTSSKDDAFTVSTILTSPSELTSSKDDVFTISTSLTSPSELISSKDETSPMSLTSLSSLKDDVYTISTSLISPTDLTVTDLTDLKDEGCTSPNQVSNACSASTSPIIDEPSNKESSSSPPFKSITFSPKLNIPPPPPNPPAVTKPIPSKSEIMKHEVHETAAEKITETWPFARFPQRSTFFGLSHAPPSSPLSPSDIPLRSRKVLLSPPETKSHDPNYYNYGVCERCKKTRTGILWCKPCYSLIFQKKFRKWTSGCDRIDEFIKKNQLNSNNISELLEWIPFEKFRDLQLIGEGGYSTIYSAKWVDGRILDLNEDGKWERTGENDVVLKIMHDSKDPSQEYLNEFETYHNRTPKLDNVLRCYGISKDPFAKNTIMVMEYAKDGNLKEYLKNHFAKFTWIMRISMLNDIIRSLKSIHETGLVHKDLHSDNVLIHDNHAFIGDLGLCSKVQNNDSTSLHGVMPYVAPEVLKGNQFTTSSDIYSFGMIMYELAVSLPPFHDYSSDESLLRDICDEVRPKIPKGIPNCYVDLMTKCWSQNPEDRPNADYLTKIIKEWKGNVSEEFNDAEKFRLSKIDKCTNFRENSLGNYKSKALPKFCEISSN